MMPNPSKFSTDIEPSRLVRMARFEGYLSMPMTFCHWFFTNLYSDCTHHFPLWIPRVYEIVIGASIWSIAWLFALSGVRHAIGWARLAAGASVFVLVIDAGFVLLFSLLANSR